MDRARFDTLARSLATSGSRRRALALALGGALGIISLAYADDVTARGTCRPKCGECETCKKGGCDKKNGKKRCKKGRCKPQADGASCTTFPGGACQNGTCVDLQADEANCGSFGTVCGPTQVCQAGSCFSKSTCPATATTFCPFVNSTGCGSSCACGQSTEGNVVCVTLAGSFCPPPNGPATPCTTSASCPPGSACMDTRDCCGGTGAKSCVPQCPAPDA